MIKEEDLYKIGFFAKPHGIKGEIALVTDFDMEDISGDPFVVCNIDDIWTPFFFTSYRQKNASTLLITFHHIDSAENVKFLSNKTAFVPVNLLPPQDMDDALHISDSDLIGYSIIDETIGKIGLVKEIDDRTLNKLLMVDYLGNDIFIPLALATSIQYELKTINLSLPDGFLEI